MAGDKQHTLTGTRELLDSDANGLEVRYYRAEDELSDCKMYGVRIETYVGDNGSRELNESYEQYVTTNKEQIDEILDRLIGNSVTACTASEVLDCLYDETI